MACLKRIGLAAFLFAVLQGAVFASPITVYNMTSNPLSFNHTLCSASNGICRLSNTDSLEPRTSQRNEMRIVLPIDNNVDQFVVSSANILDQGGKIVGKLVKPCRMSKDVGFVLFTLDGQNNLVCQHGA